MININDLEIKIPSETSSGGWVKVRWMAGHVELDIESLDYDGKTPRTDVRVNLEDLKKAIAVLEAVAT